MAVDAGGRGMRVLVVIVPMAVVSMVLVSLVMVPVTGMRVRVRRHGTRRDQVCTGPISRAPPPLQLKDIIDYFL